MKYFLTVAGLLSLAVLGTARAQDGQMAAPPDEIITDFGIDEYLSVPKWNLTIGARSVQGPKTSFSGAGSVASFHPGDDYTTPNITRIYQDGSVLADTQPYIFTTSNVDGSTTDHQAGPTPAGNTNTWSMLDLRQIRDDGNIDFHSYSANISGAGVLDQKSRDGLGIEITLSHDLGQITKKLSWKIFTGVSLTDISAHNDTVNNVAVTTLTDTYVPNTSVSGALPTTVPYTAPSFKQVPRVDENGQPVYDSTGTQIIDYVETTVYLGNAPFTRTITTSNGLVYTHWGLKGAYFTFRLGPSFDFQFNRRLHLTLSAGAALVFTGTQYDVSQIYTPDVGSDVIATATDEESKFLNGYYVDATLQFDFTYTAGLYAGYGYQDNGSYTQTANIFDEVTGSIGSYKAVVNLSGLTSWRMGMTFRF